MGYTVHSVSTGGMEGGGGGGWASVGWEDFPAMRAVVDLETDWPRRKTPGWNPTSISKTDTITCQSLTFLSNNYIVDVSFNDDCFIF